MLFPSFFKSCLSCCDTSNDGTLPWDEVMMSAVKTIDFLNRTAQTLALYGTALEAAGIDMIEVNIVFDRINTILSTTGKGVHALKNIKVSVAKGEVGGVNGDGVVNKDDVKIYFKGAQDISKAIAGAGMNLFEMNAIQITLQAIMDAIDRFPKSKFEASKPASAAATI